MKINRRKQTKKEKLIEWIDDNIWWPTLGRLFEKIKDIRRELRLAYQRARYGIDDSMTWDLDSYLISHITKLLKQYDKERQENIIEDEEVVKWLKDCIKDFGDYDEFLSGENSPCRMEEGESYTHFFKRENEYDKSQREKMKKLFDQHFRRLWW